MHIFTRLGAALLFAIFAMSFSNFSFSTSASAQETGIAIKKPVMAAACARCPWGAMAEILKQQMAPYGYDVQVCYNCNLAEGPRIVDERKMPPPLTQRNFDLGVTTRPNGPADFGITGLNNLVWSYKGIYDYAKDGPRPNLRLIAMIENPSYLMVAVKADSGITDLSQLKGRKNLRIMAAADSPFNEPILKRYSITEEEVKANGGTFVNPGDIVKKDFDVLIHSGMLGNHPEANVFYEESQKRDLRFLDLPTNLLDEMAKNFGLIRADIPVSYLRGIDRRIPTVVRPGQVIFGRADMGDQFAYDVAKAANEKRELWKFGLIPFVYDSRTVTQAMGVPLADGAARYYREVGYIK